MEKQKRPTPSQVKCQILYGKVRRYTDFVIGKLNERRFGHASAYTVKWPEQFKFSFGREYDVFVGEGIPVVQLDMAFTNIYAELERGLLTLPVRPKLTVIIRTEIMDMCFDDQVSIKEVAELHLTKNEVIWLDY